MSAMSRPDIPKSSDSQRQELKQRMARSQFSFGPKNKGNDVAQSMYVSEIDEQAKQGKGMPADGDQVRNAMKTTNVRIGASGAPHISQA